MKNEMLNLDFYVPLITPFCKDGSVDYAGLTKAVRHVKASGAGGIYAIGSSAECFLLSVEERKKALETITAAAEGEMDIIAHVGHLEFDAAATLARHAKSVGVSGISAVPPFYYRYTFDEIKDYYRALADAAKLPVMIYSISATTGVSFSIEQFAELLTDSRFPLLKYTEKEYYVMERIKAAAPQIRIYSGADECFLSALAAGADGAIGTSLNFAMRLYIDIKRLYVSGDMAGALTMQSKANALIQVWTRKKAYASVKYLMTLQGLDIEPAARFPFLPLDEQDKRLLETAYKEIYLG